MRKRIVNLIGKRFGRLNVLKYIGCGKWLCKCSCGNTKTILGSDLTRKKITKDDKTPTRSCGCLKIDLMRKNYGEASFNRVYKRYKDGAKQRNVSFHLSKKFMREMTSSECFYCGRKPEQVIRDGSYFGDYVFNGIDRIDNSKGYIKGNVVPCCKRCNIAKHILAVQSFKEMVVDVYNHWAKF